jgi:hypothetical protein
MRGQERTSPRKILLPRLFLLWGYHFLSLNQTLSKGSTRNFQAEVCNNQIPWETQEKLIAQGVEAECQNR